MSDFTEVVQDTNQELKCHQCGAVLKYKPGTTSLSCEYCGAQNEIKVQEAAKIEEIDYVDFINNKFKAEDKQDVSTVKCTSCGASTTLKPNVTSDQCPFCGTSLVISNGTTSSQLRPKSLLPFKIEQKQAMELFKTWVKKLWFAPNKLKKFIHSIEKLVGMYIPYWTYDSDTTSHYTGERGTHYYVTETYTTTENGQTVTKTRQVQKTRWTPVSGTVTHWFDDVLVPASNTLPKEYVVKLEPWDTENLVPFDDKFLSGFKAESYQVDLVQGFEEAKEIMADTIDTLIRQDIGGDEQRVHHVDTKYDDITFKHVLFPLYISAYQFRNKVYRFLVNARTGEVQGERPYSFWKIFFFVLTILIVIAGLVFLYYKYGKS
jgi:LSD1 subclass zinc finger protein